MSAKSLSFEPLESRELFAGDLLSGNIFQRSALAITALQVGGAAAHQQVASVRAGLGSHYTSVLRNQGSAAAANAGQIAYDAVTGDYAGLQSNQVDAVLIARQAVRAGRALAAGNGALSAVDAQIDSEVASAVHQQSLILTNLAQGKITLAEARRQQVEILSQELSRFENDLDAALTSIASEGSSQFAKIDHRIHVLSQRDGVSSGVAALLTTVRKR